ncbi:MAG TPA: hypothetical protein PKC28_10900, partial [Bdellovibrionales bacterium]|nr:hypothetical protein [Bdellovibrionales bacterium]
LEPPSDYIPQRRLVILVDMSNSMLSGSCPQDVDGGMLFETNRTPFTVWDPNKRAGNFNDHRGSGADCRVNANLPISRASVVFTPPNLTSNPPVFYETSFGVDHEQDRLKIIRKWIKGALETGTPVVRANAKVMLLPVTGGRAQEEMMAEYPLKDEFIALEDPRLDVAIQWLIDEHNKHKDVLQSTNFFRYQHTRMGTTAPTPMFRKAFDAIKKDMRDLYNRSVLNFGEYEFVYLSDGKVTPLKAQFEKALSVFHQCTACADNYQNCSGVCSLLAKKMETAWGLPAPNEDEHIDFEVGLMQSLPYYYGAGQIRINFMQLKKARFEALNPGETSMLDRVRALRDALGKKISVWQAPDDQPPYFPVGTAKGGTSFKMTHMYIINPNARVSAAGALQADSDGDGVVDEDEAGLGTNPGLSRTNGYCLDGFRANPTFNERCEALAKSKSCDPTLDSDGDSLNECEETLLGTDPFDFDSDADGIPDYLEWLYGFNPLVDDANIDANGDGAPNTINFSYGLNPNVKWASVPEHLRPIYHVNFMGREQLQDQVFGTIWIELNEVLLKHMPLAKTVAAAAQDQTPLYAARASVDPAFQGRILIPDSQRLISVSGRAGGNSVLAVARIIDVDDPRRAYWRVKKWDIFVNSRIANPRVDLSNFEQVRAMDEN